MAFSEMLHCWNNQAMMVLYCTTNGVQGQYSQGPRLNARQATMQSHLFLIEAAITRPRKQLYVSRDPSCKQRQCVRFSRSLFRCVPTLLACPQGIFSVTCDVNQIHLKFLQNINTHAIISVLLLFVCSHYMM